MPPSFYVWWRKERKRVVMSVMLLIFGSTFVKKFQFLRWACQGISALVTRPSYGDGQGITYFLPGYTPDLWSEQTEEKFGFDSLFFP